MNRDELGLDRGEEARQTGPLSLSSLREKELQGHGGASSQCPRNVHCCVLNWSSGETGLDFVLLRSFNFY